MRLGAGLFALVLAVPGCSSSHGELAECIRTTDCATGLACIDGVCREAPSDGGTRVDTGDRPAVDPDGGGPPETGVDAGCGATSLNVDINPPNVLVIFDRSCSMRRRIDASEFGSGPEDPRTRWHVAREAVRQMTTRRPAQIRWGLMVYPEPREQCGDTPAVDVLPAAFSADSIYTRLRERDVQPFGLCGPDNTDTVTQPRVTPTWNALEAAMSLRALRDGERPGFVVLLTDGGATCEREPSRWREMGAALVAAGIPTAVVGFSESTDAGWAEDMLNALAETGGLPRAPFRPYYYRADDSTALDSVLEAIAGETISCTLGLDGTPPDSDALFVSLDGATLALDGSEGFTYDAGTNTITLHGTPCDRLRSGMVTRLSVVYGCPTTTCIPNPAGELCNGLDDDCDDVVDEDCLR